MLSINKDVVAGAKIRNPNQTECASLEPMNNSTGYAERIHRVVGYLDEHLDQALDFETLARVACFSPDHFHRIYHALLGETVSETVCRLRLHRAAIDLLDRELSIERTASRAGYASQAEFTRAFRAEYGRPPARYRGARQAAQFHPESNPSVYQVEIVTLARIRIAAIQHRGDYQFTGRAFERLMALAATTGLLTSDTRSMGIFYDDPASVPEAWASSEELTEDTSKAGATRESSMPAPTRSSRRPRIGCTQTWLPNSAEKPRNLPCIGEYLNSPRQVLAKDLETAVLMPLAARSL
jgi:AraC family transcriptional regulator